MAILKFVESMGKFLRNTKKKKKNGEREAMPTYKFMQNEIGEYIPLCRYSFPSWTIPHLQALLCDSLCLRRHGGFKQIQSPKLLLYTHSGNAVLLKKQNKFFLAILFRTRNGFLGDF